MLSRRLQRSSPHREPRTSEILPGITPSSSLFRPLSMCSLSGFVSLSLNSSFSTSLHHSSPCSSLPYNFNTRPLSSLSFSAPTTALLSPPKRREEKGEEKHRKKNSLRVAGTEGKQHRPVKIDYKPSLAGISGVGWLRGS